MQMVENEEETLQGLLEDLDYRVLLVCENALIRFTLQNFFKDSHVTVTAAADDDEGLRIMKKEKFDAVISEICTDADKSLLFRKQIRLLDEKVPILFMTPLFFWTDVRLLDRIVEDPHSYYIPENADRKFMTAKLRQVIGSCRAENSLNHLKSKIARNWILASQLQQAMLPPWVYFSESYEFSCYYRPFSRVSGDLFEWLPLDDDRAVFVFGDISGHGTHSALAMTAVQSFLKQIILQDKERAKQPSLIAAEINNFLCSHLRKIVYMGTLIAYIDFRNNFLRYQNAGYMDLVCINAETGKAEELNPEKKGSVPPGMMPDTVYTSEDDVECRFSDTSVFLCCSDGLMDLARDKEGHSNMNMKTCLELASVLITDSQKEERSIAIPFRCCHTLQQFGYRYPQDDLSVVLIRKPLLKEREYTFSCRVPADKMAIDEICQRASAFVTQHYDDEELSVDTELLIEEYLINVILHGLSEYEKLNEYIAVKLCAFDDELKIIIWDHGKEWNGFITQTAKADARLDQLNEDMAASGRGLPIISKITSKISRQRFSGLNESVFVIPCRAPRLAGSPTAN